MKKTINLNDFVDEFRSADRVNQFTYDGKKALFDYLDQMEGEDEYDLDIIGLCCEFTEYEDLEKLQGDYDDIKSIEDLEENKSVIYISGTDGFIIQNY